MADGRIPHFTFRIGRLVHVTSWSRRVPPRLSSLISGMNPTLRVECSVRHTTSFVTHFVLSIALAGCTHDIADDCPLLALKTRTGRTFAATPRSAIQISPRLALVTALLLLAPYIPNSVSEAPIAAASSSIQFTSARSSSDGSLSIAAC